MSAGKGSYRRALANRDFRLLAGALTQSAMGDWAYNVAFVVWVYDRTHSAGWVSAATLGRMLPRLIASPYGGVLAERFERVRVMVTADVIRAGLMALLAVVVASNWPVWLAIVVGASMSVTATVYDPATAAMVPQLLGEDDLAAGNALTETINNVAIIAGPAIGAIVLALGEPSVVMALDAVTFVVSALLVSRLSARSTPTDVTADGGPLQQIAVGVRAIVGSSTAALLVGFTIATTMLYGADTVLFILVSASKLGTGAEGYGYLLVGLGVGGIIAALFINRLAALPRLSLVLAVGMIVYAAPTALLVVVHSPTLAFAIQVVRGMATIVVDVLAMTALQRSLAPELISRVFGVFWALVIGGLSLGAALMPLLLKVASLDTTLLLTGLVVPVGVLLVLPRLTSLDTIAASQAELLAPRVSVLGRLDIFAAASQPMLERLARRATEVVLEPSTTVIRQGDPADALYVLLEGSVDVSFLPDHARKTRHIRTMEAPAYFGEIGVLQGVPRTATVTASTAARLLRIDGDTFVGALTETSLSAAFLSGMNMRLARTHPDRNVTLPQQRTDVDITLDVDAPVSATP
jgi:CRP-like cAMP-binding protein/predicted MFS family arabinose efflux permease